MQNDFKLADVEAKAKKKLVKIINDGTDVVTVEFKRFDPATGDEGDPARITLSKAALTEERDRLTAELAGARFLLKQVGKVKK